MVGILGVSPLYVRITTAQPIKTCTHLSTVRFSQHFSKPEDATTALTSLDDTDFMGSTIQVQVRTELGFIDCLVIVPFCSFFPYFVCVCVLITRFYFWGRAVPVISEKVYAIL